MDDTKASIMWRCLLAMNVAGLTVTAKLLYTANGQTAQQDIIFMAAELWDGHNISRGKEKMILLPQKRIVRLSKKTLKPLK